VTIPNGLEDRHELLIELRHKAYNMLCDSLYSARGYDSNAVPLVETVQKMDLFDEQARVVIAEYSLKN